MTGEQRVPVHIRMGASGNEGTLPRPFESHQTIKKHLLSQVLFFMGWLMGLEPTIFRATI